MPRIDITENSAIEVTDADYDEACRATFFLELLASAMAGTAALKGVVESVCEDDRIRLALRDFYQEQVEEDFREQWLKNN